MLFNIILLKNEIYCLKTIRPHAEFNFRFNLGIPRLDLGTLALNQNIDRTEFLTFKLLFSILHFHRKVSVFNQY